MLVISAATKGSRCGSPLTLILSPLAGRGDVDRAVIAAERSNPEPHWRPLDCFVALFEAGIPDFAIGSSH